MVRGLEAHSAARFHGGCSFRPRSFDFASRFTAVAAAALLSFSQVFQGANAEQLLAGHSLTAPPDINQLSSDWFLAGTAIPSLRALVLQPGTPYRVGMMWSLYPLLTNDFEVSMKISIKSPPARTAEGEGFAFWYVYENASDAQLNVSDAHVQSQDAIIANTWDVAMTTAGFDLLGYRSKFEGVGVFFTPQTVTDGAVSVFHNDGKKQIKARDLPAADAVKIERSKELVVKVRVQPTITKITVEGKGTTEVKADFKSGGYLGLTAYGGLKGTADHNEKADFVEVSEFKVTNFDAKAQGESMPQPESKPKETPKPLDEKSDVLADSSSFRDHRAESDAIKELTNMVFKLTMETQPMRAQLQKAIGSLEKRITTMEKTFEHLKQEIDKKTGHHLGKEFDAIKKELSSLSNVASKETQERHKRLESLHEDIADVHKTASAPDNIDHHLSKLTESNQRTLNSLTNEHQKMFGVSIAAIGFVIIAGLSLYNKFRCWEKKHIL